MRSHPPLEVGEHTPSPRRTTSARNIRNRQTLARRLHGAGDVGPGVLLGIATSAIITVVEKGEVRRQDLEAPHWLTRPKKKRRMMERRRAAIERMHRAGIAGLRRRGIRIDDEASAAVEAAAQGLRLKLVAEHSFTRKLIDPRVRRSVRKFRPTAHEARTFRRNVDVLTSTKRRWTVTPLRPVQHQAHSSGMRHRRAPGSAPTRSRGSSRSAGGGSSGDDGDGDPEPPGLSSWRRLRDNRNTVDVLVGRAGS